MNYKMQSIMDKDCCKYCSYWQGFSEWGDCYRVIAALNPDLLKVVGCNGCEFTVPYDPHDYQKYACDARWRSGYQKLMLHLPEGVIKEKVDQKTIYLKTNRLFWCHYYRRKT